MSDANVANVKMNTKDAIINKTADCGKIADTVLSHLLETRPVRKPMWKPYIYNEGISYRKKRKHDIFFDMKSLYPESKSGDVVYTSCNIMLEKDYTVWINVTGLVAVFLNGKCLFSSFEEAESTVESKKYISIPVDLKKGEINNLVIKYVFEEENGGFWLNISPPSCVSLWANFYLIMARVHFPIAGLTEEEGVAVSPLYKGNGNLRESYYTAYSFEDKPEYKSPEIIREEKKVDFNRMYSDGKYAYAFSFAKEDGHLSLLSDSALRVFVNNELKYEFSGDEEATIELKDGDNILLQSEKESCTWGFEINECKGLNLDFLETERKDEFTFMYCGPFYSDSIIKVDMEDIRPLVNEKEESVFWRFQNADLRAYIDSSFFGHWYYATMLCFYGMMYAGKTLGKKEYTEYFLENMSFLEKWYDYSRYDFKKYNFANFMIGASSEVLLDFNGTMGVNFIEAYKLTGEEKYKNIAYRLYENIRTKVTRFEDGTFCRKESKTMWADDFFMACPFLVRMYKEFGVKECLEDIVTQLKGFKKRLYMDEKNIFSHIFFLDAEMKNSIPWGRGNGWVALALSEVLITLNDERGEKFEILRNAFEKFCEGLASFQDEDGMWHQVLDKSDSYQEASCTAMFTTAMYRGVKNGWIDKKYMSNVKRGLKALLGKCVDKDGVFYNVCMGSSCSMDVSYYMRLGTVKDDNHGTGIILMLLGDIIKCEDEAILFNEG